MLALVSVVAEAQAWYGFHGLIVRYNAGRTLGLVLAVAEAYVG